MRFDSTIWVLRRLAEFYHSIYFYTSLFSMGYCLLVYQARERIYQMELTWGRISLVYACAGCLAAMLTLVTFYAWMSGCVIWREMEICRKLDLQARKNLTMGLSSN